MRLGGEAEEKGRGDTGDEKRANQPELKSNLDVFEIQSAVYSTKIHTENEWLADLIDVWRV